MYTAHDCTRTLARPDAGPLARLLEALRHWSSQQVLRARVRRERQQLREMPEAMLRDLGITRHDAEAESRRTDIPAARRRHESCAGS